MTPDQLARIEHMAHCQDGWEVQTVATLMRSELAELCRLARLGMETEQEGGSDAR